MGIICNLQERKYMKKEVSTNKNRRSINRDNKNINMSDIIKMIIKIVIIIILLVLMMLLILVVLGMIMLKMKKFFIQK